MQPIYGRVQANKNCALFSEDLSKKHDWSSSELCEEIEKVIGNIIKSASTIPQDIVNIMNNSQFNIDKWY